MPTLPRHFLGRNGNRSVLEEYSKALMMHTRLARRLRPDYLTSLVYTTMIMGSFTLLLDSVVLFTLPMEPEKH